MKVRPYRMGVRAEQAQQTAERILDAMFALFLELPTERIRLEDVAERADVTVQTVVRRFGSKDGLLVAVGERERDRIAAQRSAAVPGDVPGAVRNLVEHYESDGAVALKLLAEESRVPAVGVFAAAGREFHRRWCADVFAPTLAALSGVGRERRLAQLVAVCDVQTWKLLRLDAGLSRRQTELAIVELITPLTSEV